jgi:ketosteroid isomerase-like protein
MKSSRLHFARAFALLFLFSTSILKSAAHEAETPSLPSPPTVRMFQEIIDDYGRAWLMTDGCLDLSRLDRFYAAGEGVIIFDFAPPGVSTTWAAHREALREQLFAKLKVNRYVPRQDVTLRRIGPDAAVTSFTFDYENEALDGTRFTLTGRQSNVWERRGDSWVIVHEHGSPVPSF